jgi:hypothetical protein
MVDRYHQRGQRVDELAALVPFEYERQWKIAAKQLGVRPWPTRFAFNFMRSPELKVDREMVLAAGLSFEP